MGKLSSNKKDMRVELIRFSDGKELNKETLSCLFHYVDFLFLKFMIALVV